MPDFPGGAPGKKAVRGKSRQTGPPRVRGSRIPSAVDVALELARELLQLSHPVARMGLD